MKEFSDYCAQVRRQYPKTMSKEQFYQVAQISKSTALYLLKSGLVPCVDTGKKTRRYTIKTSDVIKYLRERIVHPDRYRAAVGWYAGSSGKKQHKDTAEKALRSFTQADEKRLETYFADLMKGMSDLLTVNEFAAFIGFSSASVSHWCTAGKLKSFHVSRRHLIPKECAAKYLASPVMRCNSHASFEYRFYLISFCRQHNIRI